MNNDYFLVDKHKGTAEEMHTHIHMLMHSHAHTNDDSDCELCRHIFLNDFALKEVIILCQ